MRHAKWMASLALFSLAACLATPGPAWADGIASYKIVDLGNPYNLTYTLDPSIDESGNLTYSFAKNTGIYQVGAVFSTDSGKQNIATSFYLHANGNDVNLLPPSMQDPSTGNAYRVNALGMVFGHVGLQSVVYSAVTGKFLDPKGLPGLSGTAGIGPINNLGQGLGTQDGQHLFYSSPTAVPILLTDLLPANSGWKLFTVSDINDLGEIVGNGTNPSGQEAVFELIPTTTPEPTILAILGIGMLFYGGCKFRSRILPSRTYDRTTSV